MIFKYPNPYFVSYILEILFKPLYLQGCKVWRKVDILPHPMIYSIKLINAFEKRKKIGCGTNPTLRHT